jgi:hypothetical protein
LGHNGLTTWHFSLFALFPSSLKAPLSNGLLRTVAVIKDV